jgi:Leucine-rich repeat (LRR) protein
MLLLNPNRRPLFRDRGLQFLAVLELRSNVLNALPKEIGSLGGLNKLDLMENRLNHLPIELHKLAGLTSLELKGNPWNDPTPEIISQGVPAVIAYLQKRYKESQSKSRKQEP